MTINAERYLLSVSLVCDDGNVLLWQIPLPTLGRSLLQLPRYGNGVHLMTGKRSFCIVQCFMKVFRFPLVDEPLGRDNHIWAFVAEIMNYLTSGFLLDTWKF